MQHENGSLMGRGLHWRGRHGETSGPDRAHDDLAAHLFLTVQYHFDGR